MTFFAVPSPLRTAAIAVKNPLLLFGSALTLFTVAGACHETPITYSRSRKKNFFFK